MVRYASVGTGSNNHYDTEAFAQWAGIKLYHVPNKGGGGAITNDVVRGDVQVVLVSTRQAQPASPNPACSAVLAVMADERLSEYPNVPTLKEAWLHRGRGFVVGPLCLVEDASPTYSKPFTRRR